VPTLCPVSSRCAEGVAVTDLSGDGLDVSTQARPEPDRPARRVALDLQEVVTSQVLQRPRDIYEARREAVVTVGAVRLLAHELEALGRDERLPVVRPACAPEGNPTQRR
jgi:hypothetical protein